MKPYYEHAGITIYHGDCREIMPTLAPESVSLVATDPPYFRVKNSWWDRQWTHEGQFLDWVTLVCGDLRRVCAGNASLYWFVSPEMSTPVEIRIGEHFDVLNRIRWMKPEGWHQKADQDRLRRYLSPWEEIIFAEVSPASAVAYLMAECARLGITSQRLSALLGFKGTAGSIGPRRYLSESGFAPISRADYAMLGELTGGFARPYDDLYRYFAKPNERDLFDVWEFETVQALSKHECEKPLSLMQYIVLVSSAWSSLVLDPFMGSGTTLCAAKDVGRRAIGIELEEKYCEIAAKRLSQEALPLEVA